jgi:hypothetical protein
MTLRARIAATAGVSVALAVLAAALGLYLGVRSVVRQSALSGGGYAKAANAPGGGALLRVNFGPPVSYTAPTQAKGSA